LGVSALHSGLDFRAETGDPVHATAPGTVIASGRQGGYGICVDVDHGNGVVTRYGHLSSASRAVGERVQTGDVVGLAGSTGRSTGPHLHYETRVSGEAVDPRDWLDAGRELGF
ncbi:MAG: M23 family metallopeptidase, partial [Siculibacillus sp.]